MLRRKRTILDEIDEMDRRVDEFFDRIFSFEPMWDIQAHTIMPLYDMKETRESLIVHVDLPYVEKDAIQLRVDEGSIDLSAELRRPIRYERWGTAQRDCEFRKLSATIMLPTEIESDRVTSKFRDGVLTIELPKKVRKRTIPVE
jgi:HSP20 family molecular chaperone IbpA